MHTILQCYELLNLALKEQRWSLFVFFISSSLITFMRKTALFKTPSIKNKERKKEKEGFITV